MGIFPPAIRWVSKDLHRFLLERPPAVMTLHYSNTMRHQAMGGDQAVLYQIPVPWQQYIVSFHSDAYDAPRLSTYVTPRPLRSIKDPLFVYPLPNVHAVGSVCMHIESEYPAFVRANNPTVAERVFFVANALWLSGFNTNAGNILVQANRHAPQFWETLTLQQQRSGPAILTALEAYTPADVLRWTFPQANTTVESVLQETATTPNQAFFDLLVHDIYTAHRKPK